MNATASSDPLIQKEVDHPIEHIPMDQINFRAYNVRGTINPQTCVDLARRIKTEGLRNPVEIVRVDNIDENDGKLYRLFAGFRRYMAHRINGATHIDARIYEGLSLAEETERNFTENIAREDLTFMQEARGVERLRSLRGGSLRELGEHIGKSPKWVQQRIWVLEFEPEIIKAVEEGWVKTHHIDQIKALPMGEPRFAYVRQIKSSILKGEKPRKSLARKNVFAKKVRPRPEIFELQDHIVEALGSGNFSTLPEPAKLILQALGWCAGEATDMEVYGTLRKIAKEHGLHYEIPESAMSALQG